MEEEFSETHKQLDVPSRRLLLMSAAELLEKMSKEDSDVSSLAQGAFDFYDKETKQYYQVQVIVTRDAADFIKHFTTEATINKNFKLKT